MSALAPPSTLPSLAIEGLEHFTESGCALLLSQEDWPRMLSSILPITCPACFAALPSLFRFSLGLLGQLS